MTIGSIEARSQQTVSSLLEMRRQLDGLQQQLGTGKKAVTYAGLGQDSSLAVGLHAQLSAVKSFGDTMSLIGTRISVAGQVLDGAAGVTTTVKRALLDPYTDAGGGLSTAQNTARGQLDQLLASLDTAAGDRYLFGGRKVDTPPVESAAHILDGDGARAGLTQLITERQAADRGADGLGRLVLPAASGTSVSAAEDAAPSPFGFKLTAAQTDVAGATVTGPSGSPPAISVDLGSTNPTAGNSVTVTLALPDGTAATLKLTATAAATPGAGEFAIGADATATAANLRAALQSGVAGLAKTTLPAASAMAASKSFFDADVNHPPQRVAGPPFESATALVSGTADNTVIWYKGEAGSDPARGSAVARVDDTLSVSYGLRANETAIRSLVENTAVFAATAMPTNAADAKGAYDALVSRVGAGLADQPGKQTIADISSDLGAAQSAMKTATERHTQTQSVLNGLLDQVEGVPQEQVAAEILSLQTRLQASLQASAKLFQMSLVNYL